MPQNENNLLSVLNSLPPWQCRWLATRNRIPISTKELAAKSSLSPATIKSLARADSWYHYELSTIIKFTTACGIDLLHQKYPKQRLLRMIRSSRPPAHLSTPQRKYWQSVVSGEKQWRGKPE